MVRSPTSPFADPRAPPRLILIHRAYLQDQLAAATMLGPVSVAIEADQVFLTSHPLQKPQHWRNPLHNVFVFGL